MTESSSDKFEGLIRPDELRKITDIRMTSTTLEDLYLHYAS